jgi:hypothetical protein
MKTPKEQIIELMTGISIEEWEKNNLFLVDNPDAIGESWQGDSDGTVGLD